MDIDEAHFRKHLLSILHNIANASFVTIDLEMSGITTKPQNGQHRFGKPSLQHVYEDMRDAAATYQIVQVGITCVEEDHEREFYRARPYNFNLSPLQAFGTDIKLDRDFCFASSACDFLVRNHFDFGRLFTSGVTYLSKDEERKLREEYKERTTRGSTIPDIPVAVTDHEVLQFYRKARRTITEWVESPKPTVNYVNIGSAIEQLSGYERRLVHQLVRKEFPKLRAFAKNGSQFMQITHLDERREAAFQRRKDEQFETNLAKQIGLRWIFEALSGGDLSRIDPGWFYSESQDDTPSRSYDAITKELREVTLKLKTKDHVIVGHNLFTDLGFIKSTFFDVVPIKVEHFQEDISELFPTIFDTKYLATHGPESSNIKSGLWELLEPLKTIHTPMILLDEKHSSYGSIAGRQHEAGYDSWMTAELFVKLSAKLYKERKENLGPESSNSSSTSLDALNDDTGGVSLNTTDTNGDNLIEFADNLPANNHHAQELNCFADLALLDVEEGSKEKTPLFIPSFKSKFWDAYANKLRVAGAEGSLCDLAAGFI
ncbi:ribonuclease H-like domain-containing protein [Amylocarpus encephaloides]|uniref:Ribonuclease H-like domain-containing protein n=1 Tax=Amylocarpus encephaloides TaxID=45428 RepID=A0A9P8C7X8_9HELO|nr:ribonuclease H-like domain-containing protein [Amylocarpus encephaloides]